MKEIRNKIKCPHCSEDFELEDVFKEHLDRDKGPTRRNKI